MASVGRGCIAGPLRCTGLDGAVRAMRDAAGAGLWERCVGQGWSAGLGARAGSRGPSGTPRWCDRTPPLVRPDPPLVQAGPQLVQAGPQLVQAGPQLVQAGPQLVQVPPSVRGQFSLVGGGPSLACAMFKIL
jgi:hypothetical protein